MQLMTQIFKSASKDSGAFALYVGEYTKQLDENNKEILQGLEIENKRRIY